MHPEEALNDLEKSLVNINVSVVESKVKDFFEGDVQTPSALGTLCGLNVLAETIVELIKTLDLIRINWK